MSSDFDLEEDLAGTDAEFDGGYATWATHSEMDPISLGRLAQRKDRVACHTTNEFINEAVLEATMLRNLLGDADGVVADKANTIISNLTVLSLEIQKDPVGFLLSFGRALPNEERDAWARDVIVAMSTFRAALPKEGE